MGNLEDTILTDLKEKRKEVTIFLVNGYQFRGVITGFDDFVICVNTLRNVELIYKHAVSTIVPFE